MSQKKDPIRIGQINFTNVLPVFHHFPKAEFTDKVEWHYKIPTQLNDAISSGSIDIAAISSFAYAEHFERYLVLPGLSVSAFGKVNSIYLFYKKPFKEILHGTIKLPTTSATSVILLKIIIEKFYGGKPEYIHAQPVLQEMMKAADAAVLIGDHAIKAKWENQGYEAMDLGEQWTRFTGSWMSYALWAVRKEIVEAENALVEMIFDGFVKSKEMYLANPDSVIREAQRRIGGTHEFWKIYFENLCYDFGIDQRAGLQLYFDYALELGYIEKAVPLRIWSAENVIQVNE